MSFDDNLTPCPVCLVHLPIETIFEHAAQCRATVVQRRVAELPAGAIDERLLRFLTARPRVDEYSALTEILPARLYMGSVVGAKSPALLVQHACTCIVNCAQEIAPLGDEARAAAGITDYTHLCINDVPRYDIFDDLHRGADAIHAHAGAVFVHCAMGVSRSGSIVLAYLVKHGGMSLLDALDHVKQRRDVVYPNKVWLCFRLSFVM